MSPEELNAALAPGVHWKIAYPVVEQLVREHVGALPDDISTVELCDAIYPSISMRGEIGLSARKRLFQAVAALAKHTLADCCHQGEPKRNGYGNMTRPLRWHAPRTITNVPCPHCLGKGYLPT